MDQNQDINYNELFGLPEETGEQTAESTEEAAQAAAAPAAAPAEEGDGTGTAQEGGEEQSLEERSRQAEYRRRREEREARIREQARAEERAHTSEVLRRLGMPNPKTGELVDNVDKLEAYEKALSDARLALGKGTADDIRRIVREEQGGASSTASRSPFPKGEGNAAAGAEAAPTEADFAAEIAEIQRMDPSVKDLKSIVESEVGAKFREYVGKGLNFVDAYTLAARSRLAAQQAQAAQVKAAGKDHLSATQSRGQGAEPVPADEMAMYRVFFPDASDSEIRDMAAADRKRQGR